MDDGAGASNGEVSSPPERRYKGVRFRKWGRWVSEIRMPNSRERIWLGSYESAEKAARAFDAAAVCLRGSLAGSLNFPESPPDVRYIPGEQLRPEQIQAEAARHANQPVISPVAAANTAASSREAAPAGRENIDRMAMSMPGLPASTYSSLATPGCGDDALDWSFMDALPSMPVSSAGTNAELVSAMDDFMLGSPHPVMPPSGGAQDMIDGDDDHAFISDDLWRF